MPLLTTGAGAYRAIGGGGAVTFDPVDLGTNQILSNGNLTDTGSSFAAGIAHILVGRSSGKYYCEFTVGQVNNTGIGLIASGVSVNTFLGNAQTASVGNNGAAYLGSVSGTTTCPLLIVGHVYGHAVDVDNRTMWVKDITAAGNYNADGTANPATNTNGCILGGNMATGTVFAAVMCGDTNDTLTANFGATAYVGTPPAGFGNW